MPLLTIINVSKSFLGVGGAVGVVPEDGLTKEVTVNQLEFVKDRLATLANAGLLTWTTSSSPSGADDAGEGLSYKQMTSVTKIIHKPTITTSDATSAPGQGPSPIVLGTLMGLEFDNEVDVAYRVLKVDSSFSGDGSGSDASFHVHWTKSAIADASGQTIRWRLSYTVFDGKTDEVANGTPTVLDFDDTYDDNVAGDYIVHRTPSIPAPGLVPGYYIGVCVEFVAGSTTVVNPVVISVDLLFRNYINI